MVLPIGTESDLKAPICSRKAWVWDDSGDPLNYEVTDVPADMADKVEEYREQLIETAIEQDEAAMEAYLEKEPSIETIKACIRKGTINLDFFPTYSGSSFKNKGVQTFSTAWSTTYPPAEVNHSLKSTPKVTKPTRRPSSTSRPLRALAFKIMDDKYGAKPLPASTPAS